MSEPTERVRAGAERFGDGDGVGSAAGKPDALDGDHGVEPRGDRRARGDVHGATGFVSLSDPSLEWPSGAPARAAPTTRSVPGTSAARTAYPSMMDAGNGGCGLGAVTSDASTLPTASGNGRDSSSSGAARLSTISIASGIEIMGYLCGAIVAGTPRAVHRSVRATEISQADNKSKLFRL